MCSNERYTPLAAGLPFLLVMGLGAPGAHAAEPVDPVSPTEDEAAEQVAEPGYTIGSFHLQPEIRFTTLYDDNIYATSRSEVSDAIAILKPVAKLHSHWDKHSLKIEAGAEIGRYRDNTNEDYEDYWLKTKGTYAIGKNTSLFGSAGYFRKHEGRDSMESEQVAGEPSTYDVKSLQLGTRHTFGSNVIRLAVSRERLDYDNIGTLFNDDRDRAHSAFSVRLTRHLGQRTRVYLQGTLNQRDYDMLQGGINRDSDGYNAIVGLARRFGEKNRVEVYGGVLSQDYDSPGFGRVTAADFGFKLHWELSKNTKVTGSLSRTLGETTLAGASGYLLTKLDLHLARKFSSKTTGFLGYTHGHYAYQGLGRKDSYNAVTLGLDYHLNRDLSIGASYSYSDNDSNDISLNPIPGGSYDFDKNRLQLALKARF